MIQLQPAPDRPATPKRVWAEVVLEFPTKPMPIVVIGDGGSLTGVRFGTAGDHAKWLADVEPDPDALTAPISQLRAYAGGQLEEFDLAIRIGGTAFQNAVWTALVDVPYGRTVTYGELAARVGRPGSARAVGAAVGSNPIGIVVPCHRVIGANGSLTGFGGGLDNKVALLAREGATAF